MQPSRPVRRFPAIAQLRSLTRHSQQRQHQDQRHQGAEEGGGGAGHGNRNTMAGATGCWKHAGAGGEVANWCTRRGLYGRGRSVSWTSWTGCGSHLTRPAPPACVHNPSAAALWRPGTPVPQHRRPIISGDQDCAWCVSDAIALMLTHPARCRHQRPQQSGARLPRLMVNNCTPCHVRRKRSTAGKPASPVEHRSPIAPWAFNSSRSTGCEYSKRNQLLDIAKA